MSFLSRNDPILLLFCRITDTKYSIYHVRYNITNKETVGVRIILTLICFLSLSSAHADLDTNKWLEELRSDALADGISPATLDAALTDVGLNSRWRTNLTEPAEFT